MLKKITCKCGYSFEQTVETSIDLDAMPNIIEQIKTGVFLSYTCPFCASKMSIELQTEFLWKSKNTTLLFVPETKRMLYRSLCAGEQRVDLETNKKITIKKHHIPVIGYPELADRVAVLSAALNPLIIEAVKFFILSSKKEAHAQKMMIVFEALTADENLEFHVHGMREHEVAVLTVPVSLYHAVESDYRHGKHKDVFNALQLGQYLSYKNIAVEEERYA
ncbi:MAG: CpXC domain-containing protein [Treponema sp.]